MSEALRVWVQSELRQRKWSQRELARISGISQPLISQSLRGDVPPSADFCIKLAHALETSPENVLRIAGILPPDAPAKPTDNTAIQELVELARHLPPERLEEALRYIRYLHQSDRTPEE